MIDSLSVNEVRINDCPLYLHLEENGNTAVHMLLTGVSRSGSLIGTISVLVTLVNRFVFVALGWQIP